MIPSVIDVFGKPYSITVIQREQGDYGECRSAQCQIDIASYQCAHQKRDTLLHEVSHAIEHELNLGLTERTVRLFATGLLAVLRQNPALVAFLTGDE